MGKDALRRDISAGTLVDGRKTCTATATAEALTTASTIVDWIAITAETDNTSVLAVGASTVVATVLTRRGTPLYAGESLVMRNVDLNKVYVDAGANGEGVTYTYRT